MNFLVSGPFFLAAALEWLGHRVVQAESWTPPEAVEMDLAEVWAALPAADRPDLVLVAESLGPRRLPLGLEKLRAPRVFYALDPHLNLLWQQGAATAFDLVLTTQKSALAAFRTAGRPAFWLPWAVDLRQVYDHGLPRVHDIAFVGRSHPHFRAKRRVILHALRRRFSLVARGERPETEVSPWEMGRLYSQARLVVNEAIHQEVNLRVFEALAAGACLLTEEVGENLQGLFRAGEELITYGSDDLVEKAAHYLEQTAAREALAARGQARVRREHQVVARAQQLLQLLGEREWGFAEVDHLHLAQSLVMLCRKGLYPVRLGLRRAWYHLEEALRREPRQAPAHHLRAQVCLMRQDLVAAHEALEEALLWAPGDFHLFIQLGHVLTGLHRPQAAALAYLEAIEQAGQAETPLGRELKGRVCRGERGAAFFSALGRFYEGRGLTLEVGLPPAGEAWFFSTAAEYYQKALSLQPDHLPALAALGRLLLSWGFACEAASFLSRCVALEPQSPEYRWLLGEAQVKGFQPVEGLQNLLLAQVMEPHRDLLGVLRRAHLGPQALKALIPLLPREWTCQVP